jgi:hypothetical protein
MREQAPNLLRWRAYLALIRKIFRDERIRPLAAWHAGARIAGRPDQGATRACLPYQRKGPVGRKLFAQALQLCVVADARRIECVSAKDELLPHRNR